MRDFEKLFDSRYVIGCKLEQLIKNRSYTKNPCMMESEYQDQL